MANGNLLQVNVKLLKMWSIYPPKADAHILIVIANRLYQLITVATLYFVVIPCAYELYLGEKSKITDYTLNIMNTGAYFCSIFTMHFFHTQGVIGRQLITELNENVKHSSDPAISEVNVDEMDKRTRKITIGFFSLLGTGVLSMTFVPLLMKGRILPVPGAYPFNWKDTPNYQVLYIVQSYAQLIVGSGTSSADAFFISMVLLAAEAFKVLACDFKNCFYNALANSGISKEEILDFKNSLSGTDDRNTFRKEVYVKSSNNSNQLTIDAAENVSSRIRLMRLIESSDFQISLEKLLIKYIKNHQTLLEFCIKMEDFFWPLIFIKVGVSMFYHIFITFAMVSSTDTSMAITLAQYEFCAVAELFIFALAGQALINESENVRSELYKSPWYLCSNQYKKTLNMVLMRCTRPTRVSVGKLMDMSLPTFIVIMKTALSYFAVLRQVTE